jgi:predicted amidohydrolase
MRIALANLRVAGSPDESVELVCDAIARAAAAGAGIVCTPECYVPGYRILLPHIGEPDERFLEAAWAKIAGAARDANVAVILGTERVVDGRRHLTALVINRDGSIAGWQDKAQLDPSEDDVYARAPTTERKLFEVDGVPFGVVICHEGWRYPETTRAAARRGAKIVFHPHYHPPEDGGFRPTSFADPRNSFHEKAALCRAAENTIYFASVNCAVDGSGTTSAVANPDGTLLAWQPYGRDGLLVADIDPARATGYLASRCREADD